jgi:branched-chain amino acid transport system substrate-binding protein
MDRQGPDDSGAASRPVGRRSVLRGLGAGAVTAGAGGLLAACSSGIKGSGGQSRSGTITIGFVTPLTGPLAGFATGDQYVLSQIRESPAYSKGFKAGGKNYKVKIVVQDSQSDPNRASAVARQLILQNKVDMVLTTSTPETTSPVTAACEKLGTPVLSTVVPWESWYAALGGNPAKPTTTFKYATMFFFGLKEFQGCFAPMWQRVHSNKVVACQYPNDADGNAFRGVFEPLIKSSGYKVVDGGAYQDGTTDFSSMISTFKNKHCELFSNAPLPPDFSAFWKQASQQGFRPKLATVAKVLLFPADTAALGPLVSNVATDSWWSPYVPYKSSLTGTSAKALADGFTSSTGKLWVQSIGSTYSLFEVAKEAFSAASDPHDKAEVAAALHKVSYTGICGPLNFAGGPAPGVGIIPPAGAQWKKGTGKFPFEMQIVDNSLNKSVRITADLQPTNA